MIKIVIADDHELLREGVKKIIRSHKDMRVVAEAATLPATVELIEQHRPDIVILDISLPEHDGLTGLEKVRQKFPATPVLMLSMYPEERYAIRALRKGASGYITKSMAAEELVKAIRKIMAGRTFVSPRLAELLAHEVREAMPESLHKNLTERELQVISMLGSGQQAKQIAAALAISVSTVNTYRSRIFRKTGLTSNAALIRYAVEHRLFD